MDVFETASRSSTANHRQKAYTTAANKTPKGRKSPKWHGIESSP